MGAHGLDDGRTAFYDSNVMPHSEHGVYVGDVFDKVGARTGWTWGHVKRTCVDITTGEKTWRGTDRFAPSDAT